MRTLLSFGLGALTMYLLDPQQGRRRRALLRDQLTHARRVVRERAAGSTPGLSYHEYVKSAEAPQGAQHLGR